jgi:hypothetical protein
MSYQRVIPRDFFNEAKLLKCLGRFELAVNHGGPMDIRLPITIDYDGEAFVIEQNPNDGSLWCVNYRAYLAGEEVQLFVPYNSKDEWPLMCIYKAEEYYAFDESGKFMPNFGVK